MAGMRGALAGLSALLVGSVAAFAQSPCAAPAAVCESEGAGHFGLITAAIPAPIIADADDWPGVLRAVEDLQSDLGTLAGRKGLMRVEASPQAAHAQVVLVGTLGRHDLIDALVREGRLDVSSVSGVWEAYTQAVVEDPLPGVERALVIAGADKRGTIFGVYDLVERAGVSPWAWWADVPVARRDTLTVAPGVRKDAPKVRYRGFFINDENPALYGWVNHTFGGFNSAFYERVYELILRLKGNFLWPAMWGKALWDDDPRSGPLADEMGVVLSTSHHEPMGRAHVEWERFGEGAWNYDANEAVLRSFWRSGYERQKDYETVVTLGMRGDGDEAMTEGTAIALLERIVADQRALIADVSGRPASEKRSVWALYKEVQDYYDQGMRVPDDVTLLFADDNWGNIRRLPEPGSQRPGGYGVYYHFDYVGGPRNYKWLNTNQVERTWEQMNLAWEHGAREIWVVNVGDIKPMEVPLSFFMEQAWNPEAMTVDAMTGWTQGWAARTFPPEYAVEIADILTRYAKLTSRRKHELVDPDTFSTVNFDEFGRVVREWQALEARADAVRAALPEAYDDAFVQLVWFPVAASANLNALYEAVALNRLYAQQGRARAAQVMAAQAEALYARDGELTRFFHEDMAGGKWVHMMSQTHIGYTYWQQPEVQVMPEVIRPTVPTGGGFGVAVEGDRRGWAPGRKGARLPQSDVFLRQTPWIDVFATGENETALTLSANRDWIVLHSRVLRVEETARVPLTIDWNHVPEGHSEGQVTIKGPGGRVRVSVPVFKPPGWQDVTGFPAAPGFVAMQAADGLRRDGQGLNWRLIPGLGRTGDGLTLAPVTGPKATPGAPNAPRLDFPVHLFAAGDTRVTVELAPTLDVRGTGGMGFAVSFDGGDPVFVNVNGADVLGDWTGRVWEDTVARNAHRVHVDLADVPAGARTLTIWPVDPALVFQTVTVSQGPLPDSYFGPPTVAPKP